MRETKQKELILNIINNSTSHLTAEGIYEEARKVISNISLGTIYRNLNTLVNNKEIISLKTKEGITRYDNVKVPHQHFVCEKCHKVIDVFDNVKLNKNILPNCKVIDYEIKYKGICSDCLKKEE